MFWREEPNGKIIAKRRRENEGIQIEWGVDKGLQERKRKDRSID